MPLNKKKQTKNENIFLIYISYGIFRLYGFIRCSKIVVKLIMEFLDINDNETRRTLSVGCLGAFILENYLKICFVISAITVSYD